MDDRDIKDEIKKGIALLRDDTWTEDDLVSRMHQLITEAGFRAHLQRYLNRVMNMRKSQEKYWAGDKTILGKAKGQEGGVDKHSRELLRRLGITNIEEFLKLYQQSELF